MPGRRCGPSIGVPVCCAIGIVPGLANARWFAAIDSGRAAAGSLSVYTPARMSAHLKKALARGAARLNLPWWYRDQIVIASRELPPLERKLALRRLYQETREAACEVIQADSPAEAGRALAEKLREAKLI